MDFNHFESLYPEDTRFEAIEKILGFIKEGNSCQLVGLPGTGRANVLGFLSYNRAIREKHLGENQKWYHFITIDFPEIRKKPLLEATKFIFLELVDSLRERKMDEEYKKANDIFRESIGYKDELVLFQGLKKTIDLLAIEKELTVVFLFDRFEEYIPMLTPEFFSNLRVLRNRAKYRFSVVFSLNRPLEELVEPSLFAEYYEFLAGHVVYLPLVDAPGLEFRLSYLQKITEKNLPTKTKEEILKLTSGHMKLTRLCLEATLATNTVIANLSEPALSEIEGSKVKQSQSKKIATSPHSVDMNVAPRNDKPIETFFLTQKTIRGALYEIWNYLNPQEQQYLLAFFHKDSAPLTPEQIQFLEQIGVLKNNKITIPLFEAFVELESKNQKQENQKITVDENTNEIYKGKALLSDKLTASEYKLLSFLLSNPERVLEREEVISTVWKESATTAGVTDQALDQLIFRIRKKIEDDPNNPTHLQTVKGRGFKFIA